MTLPNNGSATKPPPSAPLGAPNYKNQRLFPINGCSRSTVVPDRRLFPIDGCSRSTVVPDRRLFQIDGCSRSTVVPDQRLFLIDGCSRSTVVPDRRLGASKVPKRTGFQKVHGERYKPPGREYRRPACNSLRRGIYANRRLKENRRYALTAYEGKRGPQKNGDPAIPQPF